MRMSNWKTRLKDGIKANKKSQRAVSIEAGLGPGYVNGMINDDKDATIGHLLAVCRAANLSIYKVLGDFDITPQTEEFLRLLTNADEATQRSILHLLQARSREASGSPSRESQDQQETTPK